MFLKAASGGSVVEDTATGNPVTFLTDLARPLKSLEIPFSDENGVTGLSVWHGGKNLVNPADFEAGCVWWEGIKLGGYSNNSASGKVPIVPGAKYTLTRNAGSQGFVSYFGADGSYLSQEVWSEGSKTIPSGAYFIGFTIAINTESECQLEVGETGTVYEAYKPITLHDVTFPVEAGTPTAGQLDIISGILTVTAPTAGTYQLTPQQITAFVGNNTIWSDADGNMTAVYFNKG